MIGVINLMVWTRISFLSKSILLICLINKKIIVLRFCQKHFLSFFHHVSKLDVSSLGKMINWLERRRLTQFICWCCLSPSIFMIRINENLIPMLIFRRNAFFNFFLPSIRSFHWLFSHWLIAAGAPQILSI